MLYPAAAAVAATVGGASHMVMFNALFIPFLLNRSAGTAERFNRKVASGKKLHFNPAIKFSTL
jgi:hypothetical protein